MKILIVILLFALAFSAQAQEVLYNQDSFILSGNPIDGWIFITPKFNYFGYWLTDNILGSMTINKETRIADCWLIEDNLQLACSIKEFSILMFNFPYQLIEDLKNI